MNHSARARRTLASPMVATIIKVGKSGRYIQPQKADPELLAEIEREREKLDTKLVITTEQADRWLELTLILQPTHQPALRKPT